MCDVELHTHTDGKHTHKHTHALKTSTTNTHVVIAKDLVQEIMLEIERKHKNIVSSKAFQEATVPLCHCSKFSPTTFSIHIPTAYYSSAYLTQSGQ